MASARPVVAPARPAREFPTVSLGGVPLARCGTQAVLERLATWLDDERPRRVVQLDSWLLALAVHSDAAHHCLAGADLVTAGTRSIALLGRLVGEPVEERVQPLELLLGVARAARERGRSLFLLTPEKGLGEIAAHELQRRLPGLAVAGCAHARLQLDDVAAWQRAASAVAACHADVAVVVQDGPQQDLFVQRHLSTMGCRLAFGAGGCLDELVGRVRRTPRWLARLGVDTWTRPLSVRSHRSRHVAAVWMRLAARAALARAAARRPL